MQNASTLQISSQILCFYTNKSSEIQIIRISNNGKHCFERVVFPGEQVLFEAVSNAELEIYTDSATGTTLADKILCSNIEVYG